MFSTDLTRSSQEILEDVRNAATTNAESALKMGIISVPFATLLVKLSQDAEQTAQTVRGFTKWLLVLTFALFFLTVALLAMQSYQIYQDNRFDDQSTQGRSQGNTEQQIAPIE